MATASAEVATGKEVAVTETPKAVRLVHISDTHGYLNAPTSLWLPRGNVLVHSGDFADRGMHGVLGCCGD